MSYFSIRFYVKGLPEQIYYTRKIGDIYVVAWSWKDGSIDMTDYPVDKVDEYFEKGTWIKF